MSDYRPLPPDTDRMSMTYISMPSKTSEKNNVNISFSLPSYDVNISADTDMFTNAHAYAGYTPLDSLLWAISKPLH